MEIPFFSNYWNYPPHHWAGVETPVVNRQTRSPFPRDPRPRMEEETPVVNRQTRSPFPEAPRTGAKIPTVRSEARSQLPKAALKVVEIPVRFVESETRRTAAVVKIQKVFRGFLVRKCVKKIAGIRKEVDEIEKRISEKETIVMMRRDAKERLKVNEMLMALLFRLDSIRGVDSGVRDFRKSVIKKAIMLQERVDAIVSGDIEMVDTGETVQQQEEECATDSPEPEVSDQTLEIKGSENAIDEAMKEDDHVESKEPEADETGAADQTSELQLVSVESTPDGCDTTIQSQEKKKLHPVGEEENLMLSVEEGGGEDKEEGEEDMMDIQQQHSELIQGESQNGDSSLGLGVVEGGGEKKVEEEDRSSSNRDLMERMIKGNERLTGLVTELCERQALQSRLLSSLSQRVENLEKAFQSERSKRKKKREA